MARHQHLIDLTGTDAAFSLRIGVVGRFPPSRSGAAGSVAQLVDALSGRYGMDVEVVRLIVPGEQPAAGPPVVMALNPTWELSAFAAADRLAGSDTVIFQVEPDTNLGFVHELIARLDIPVVLLVDEVTTPAGSILPGLSRTMGTADLVVVRSEAARRLLIGNGVDAEVIPHGSDWPPLNPPERPRRRILTWGFIGPELGADHVVRALPMITGLDGPPTYRIVGVGHPSWSGRASAAYRQDLMDLAGRLGVADRVEFGPVVHSRSELLVEVEAADVIAVVYDTHTRTTSRILTEAVSTARPVVATAFPGAVELLSTGAGMTVTTGPGFESRLADALQRFLTDDDAYLAAVDAARSMWSSLHWEAVIDGVAELLVRLVSRSRVGIQT